MKTKRLLLSMLFILVMSLHLIGSSADAFFNKGIAYILIKDSSLARVNMEKYFNINPSPVLWSGFRKLIEGDTEGATNSFKDFLNINHRSYRAVVGIAMSTAHMEVSNTPELLRRALRLNPGFSPAYLCQGVEYIREKNYPQAESNLRRALALHYTPEYKLILAQLYLLLDRPREVVNLLKKEADNFPENFHFNFLLAKGYYKLNSLTEMGKYVEAALQVDPRNNDANLLMSKYLVGVGDIKRAASLLKTLKFDQYNKEYVKTYAYVLLELRERRVENLLYEFFALDKWDKDINRLMGRYYLWVKGRGNVQNFINRAIMCGDDVKRLKEIFTEQYKFPEYEYIPFFDVRQIKWISDTVVLVVATQKSGDAERIFMIDVEQNKIMRTFDFRGECQDIFIPPHLEDPKYINMILSTTEKKGESVNLFAIKVSGSNVMIKPVLRGPQPMPSVHVGFNKTGSLAYITDGTLASVAFESPFSQVSAIVGRKTPVYPVFPFPVYQYNFNQDVVSKVTDPEQLRRSPIKEVQKYFLLCDAYIDSDPVKNLIRKGQQLELTSDEVVRTYIAKDIGSFIIYLSDLDNAFQAIIYDSLSSRIKKIDETMFLGKDQYAEIKILDFRQRKKDIYVLTKDIEQRLISFNYGSFLYSRLARKVADFFRDEKRDTIYVLTERSKKPHFIETDLEIIGFEPYWKQKLYSRKDLNKILYTDKEGYTYFSTYAGEVVKMDQENKFHYVGPSLEGLRIAVAPGGKKRAAFINDRLIFLKREH